MSFVLLLLALSQSIEHVRVEGNLRLSDDAIRHHAAVTTEEELAAAFQRVWAMGLFEDVRFDREDRVLVIHVQEKPLLTAYRLEGENLFQEEELLEGLRRAGFDLHTNRAFGQDDARTVERLTQQFLGDEVDVRARVEPLTDARVELVLTVEKIPIERLSSLELDGNEALTDAELRDVMHLKPRDWTTRITGRDKLSQRALEADLKSLRKLLSLARLSRYPGGSGRSR